MRRMLFVITPAMLMALVVVAMALPAWSPDGKRITFERFKIDESTSRIMVVNPDTGHTRTVVPCGGRCVAAIDPYFSPDGHSIAYSRTVSPFVPKGEPRKTPEWKFTRRSLSLGSTGRILTR